MVRTTEAPETRRLDFGIHGMSCASCVAAVERALAAVPGVRQVAVNLAAERGSVRYDSDLADPAAVIRAVTDAGYAPAVERVTLPIGGISCASCVATIEGALRKTPGVVSATVNFATNGATVEFAPASATMADLRRAVREAGYEPLDAADGTSSADYEKAAREREIAIWTTIAAIGARIAVSNSVTMLLPRPRSSLLP